MPELKLITINDIEAEEVTWLWKPYIPLGKITILQGDPGEGKTTLALAVASAITTGKSMLGSGGVTTPAGVIFQTAEDGLADTIKPRLELLGADCSIVHVIDEEEQALSLSDERIEKAIVKTGAKMFILDPLQAYLNGADMHSANGIRPLMKQLAGVADRTECAIVIIGHLNKNGSKAQYRGLGSIDIYAAARSVLTVGRIVEDGEEVRAIVHNKSNLTFPGSSLSFKLDSETGFQWTGECNITIEELFCGRKRKQESQLEKAKKIIKTALLKGKIPAIEIEQMATDNGISSKTLNRAKSELGVISIKIGGQWYWEIPIDVDYYEDRQDRQDGHKLNVTTLSIFPSAEVV